MGQHDTAGDEGKGTDPFPEGSPSCGTDRVLKNPLTDLSYEERLLVYRRRKDLTQTEMADSLGVSRKTYCRLENGIKTEKTPDAPAVWPLRNHEQCFIMRRRSGWSQEMCADLMGVSRYWYRLMEMGQAGDDKLVEFWNDNEG